MSNFVAKVLADLLARAGKWLGKLFARFSGNAKLKKEQEKRMDQADKVEELRQQILELRKNKTMAADEKKQALSALKEKLREESRKLTSG